MSFSTLLLLTVIDSFSFVEKKDLMDFRNPDNPKSNILDIEDLKKLGNKHK